MSNKVKNPVSPARTSAMKLAMKLRSILLGVVIIVMFLWAILVYHAHKIPLGKQPAPSSSTLSSSYLRQKFGSEIINCDAVIAEYGVERVPILLQPAFHKDCRGTSSPFSSPSQGKEKEAPVIKFRRDEKDEIREADRFVDFPCSESDLTNETWMKCIIHCGNDGAKNPNGCPMAVKLCKLDFACGYVEISFIGDEKYGRLMRPVLTKDKTLAIEKGQNFEHCPLPVDGSVVVTYASNPR